MLTWSGWWWMHAWWSKDEHPHLMMRKWGGTIRQNDCCYMHPIITIHYYLWIYFRTTDYSFMHISLSLSLSLSVSNSDQDDHNHYGYYFISTIHLLHDLIQSVILHSLTRSFWLPLFTGKKKSFTIILRDGKWWGEKIRRKRREGVIPSIHPSASSSSSSSWPSDRIFNHSFQMILLLPVDVKLNDDSGL